jgi:stage II sporulation protein D
VLGARADADVTNPVLLVDRGKSGEPRASLSPYFRWECELGIERIRDIVAADVRFEITGVRGLRYFGETGCVKEIGFYNADNEYWMRGFRFVSLCQRSGVDLVRSIQFSIHDTRHGILFRGRGFGHLCGMSQYSAETMAREGAGYMKILATYYPNYICATKEL